MSFSLPYPGQPANGAPGASQPVRDNFTAIAQGLNSFDGSQIQPNTVGEDALTDDVNPRLRGDETLSDFVYTGCLWSQLTGLNGTMTGGTIYVNGYRRVVNSIGTKAFTASRDTYVDIDNLGNVTYQEVTNNAASPSLGANSIRLAIVITSGSAVTFINQGQTDSTISGFAPLVSSNALTVVDTLGNLIRPTNPGGGLIGYRQITATFNTASTSPVLVTGLSCPVIVPAGRKIEVSFHARNVNSDTASYVVMTIWEGTVGSGTQRNAGEAHVPATNQSKYNRADAVWLPASSTITINAGIQGSAGSTSIAAAGTLPAFIKVKLV